MPESKRSVSIYVFPIRADVRRNWETLKRFHISRNNNHAFVYKFYSLTAPRQDFVKCMPNALSLLDDPRPVVTPNPTQPMCAFTKIYISSP